MSVNTTELTRFFEDGIRFRTLVGVGLSILGNILISVALNIQKHAHNKIQAKQTSSIEEETLLSADPGDIELNEDLTPKLQQKNYLKSRSWWLGLVLMVLGEVGNFLAYGFAPASLIAPLGTVGLISNSIIAPLFLKEKFRRRDFVGILLSMTGAVMVVFTSKDSGSQLPPEKALELFLRPKVYIYICICIGLLVLLSGVSRKHGKKSVLIDISLVALYGGFTVLSTKAVSSLLSAVQLMALTYFFFYVLVIILAGTAVLQVKYLNKALQNFDSTVVIPTQFVLFTLSAVTGSAVLYDDFESFSGVQYFTFILGCLLTFSGVYFIASLRETADGSLEGPALFERSHSRSSSASSNFSPELFAADLSIPSPAQRRRDGPLVTYPSFSPSYTYGTSPNVSRLAR